MTLLRHALLPSLFATLLVTVASAGAQQERPLQRSNRGLSVTEFAQELEKVPVPPQRMLRPRGTGSDSQPSAPTGPPAPVPSPLPLSDPSWETEPIPVVPDPSSPDPATGANRQRPAPELRRPELRVTPQVGATRLPSPDDGLNGNRQIALTPFPNLDLQSGPLGVHQLPWRRRPTVRSPHSAWRTIELETAVGSFAASGLPNGGLGWRNTLQMGVPFWRERQVGLHLGAAVEPTSFPQVLTDVTAGLFHHAIWPEEVETAQRLRERLSWGSVIDISYDSEHRVTLGQMRTQLGYSLSPRRETGLWVVIPSNDNVAAIGSADPVFMAPSALGTVYYRQTFANELDITGYMGVAEHPGGLHLGCYVSKRFSQQLFWTFSAMNNFNSEGSYAIYAGLKIAFWPMPDYSYLSGNPQNLYRPFLRTADHTTFQYRMRSP